MAPELAACPLAAILVASTVLIQLVQVDAATPAYYVFGDSTNDVGNNNFLNLPTNLRANYAHNGIDYPGGIPTGRFSNGYNAVDFLAGAIGLWMSPPPFLSLTRSTQMMRGVNFASGGSGILDSTGAGTISLKQQIIDFESVLGNLTGRMGKALAKHLISKSIFYFSTGSNDLFTYFSPNGPQNEMQKDQFVASLVLEFEEHLTMLYKLGARKFLVFGTSNIGCVPLIRSSRPSGDCNEESNDTSRRFKNATRVLLHDLSGTLEGMLYSFADTYEMASRIRATPALFGFTELNSACCGSGRFKAESPCTPNTTYCPNRDNHLYWDWVHPTEAIYKLVADMAFFGSQGFTTPISVQQLINA